MRKNILLLTFSFSLCTLCRAQFIDLLDFNSNNGAYPLGSISRSGNTLYGMTNQGGYYNGGCVFACDTNGNGYSDLLDFDGANGAYPGGSLLLSGNVLYGMTAYGGAYSAGNIFSILTDGSNYSNLVDFDGANGENPAGSLIISGSTLYGMTNIGAAYNYGNIFSIHTDGSGFTDLLDFNGNNGAYPDGDLTLSGTVLYGLVQSGGAYAYGCIFSINTNGSGFSDLFDFNGNNGAYPLGNLTLSGNMLYGMTYQGGSPGYGCVFSIHTNGNGYKDLLNFNGTNGGNPWGSLTLSGNLLYGMVTAGGGYGYGSLFFCDTTGSIYNDLEDFDGPDGAYPYGSLSIKGSLLYGMTSQGGLDYYGNIFSNCKIGVSVDSVAGVTCIGGSDGRATAYVSGGGTPPFTYLWSDVHSQTHARATGLSAGVYTVTVAGNGGGGLCNSSTTVTITQPNPFTVSVNIVNNVLCYGGNTGRASAIMSGGRSPFTYSWAPHGGNSDTATGLSVGNYTVTVHDFCGSLSTASVTIIQPSAVAITMASHTNPTCNGGTGSATANPPTGGTGTPLISTFAGTGSYAYSEDGGLADTSALAGAAGVAIDVSGNVYIADLSAARIRKVNSAGIMTTVAGNGDFGYSGDGGAATAAEMQFPYGVTVDGSGNIFIADGNDVVVRKVNASGIITTFAGNGTEGYSGDGGLAVFAELGLPSEVAVDGSGNVYISDFYDNRIRKVTTAGIISTIAGNGYGAPNSGGFSGDGGPATAAEINGPWGVAIDASGNILIADEYNHRIRKVTTSGIITTIAGTGVNSYNGDGIQATAADLNFPIGVILDGSGNIYFAEFNNNRVRKINTSGIISTVAGNGIQTYNGDGIAATAASLNNPNGLAFDALGDLFIADRNNSRVRKVGTGYTYSWYPNGGNKLTASNLAAGTYTILVTDDNGCNAAATVTITQPIGFSVSASVTNNVNCNGQNNGSATSSMSGGTSPYTYSWSSGATTIAISGLSAGTYSLLVRDFNACAETTITITQPNVLNASIITTNATCFESNNGSVSASIIGGILPYTYAWTGGNTNSAISGLSPGTYTLSVIDNHDCVATASTTITQPIALTASVSVSSEVTCNGLNNGSANTSVIGGTPIFSRIITTVAGNGSPGFNGNGIPAILSELSEPFGVAVDGSGNIYIADVNNNRIRKVNTAGIISTIAGNGTQGYNGDSIPATSADLNSPFNIALDNSGNLYIADEGNARIRKVNSSGIISTFAGKGITGYNGDGIPSDSAELNEPIGLGMDGSGNIYISEFGGHRIRKVNTSGIISTIAGNGTLGYYGDGGVATAAELQNPESVVVDGSGNVFIADTYNYRIRKVNTSGIIVTVAGYGGAGYNGDNILAINASINVPRAICVDGSGNIYIADCDNNRTRMVNTSGIISTLAGTGLPGYNGDGIAADTAKLYFPEGLAIDNSGGIFISDEGNSRIRKLTTYNYTYSWAPIGGTTNVATSLSNGTYTVTVTDGNGCVTTASTTITEPAILSATAIINSHVSCNGLNNGRASSSVNGGTLPYTYSWTGGGTTATVSGLSAGTYTLSLSDKNGCASSSSITITQPGMLIATTIDTANVGCHGDNTGVAVVRVNGGTSPYAYLWSPNGGTDTIANLLTANTYTANITDSHNCTASASVIITQPASPLAIIMDSVRNVSCYGEGSGRAWASDARGGTSPYAYYWLPSGGRNTRAIGLTAGSYTIVALDSHFCVDSATVVVTQPTELSVNTMQLAAVSCYGGSNGSVSSTSSGGTLPYTYSWSNGATMATVSGLSAGNYSLTLTDKKGCSVSASSTVIQPSILDANIGITSAIYCNGGSASIKAIVSGGTNPYTYRWSNSQTSDTIKGLSTGVYSVAVSDFCGDVTSASITITQPNVLSISIASVNNVLCNGGTGSAAANIANGGTSPYLYSWSPAGGSATNAGGLSAGSYTITVKDDHGCNSTASVSITQPLLLAVTANITAQSTCSDSSIGSISASPSGGTSPFTYLWTGGGTDAGYTGLSGGTYSITVTDNNGCTAMSSATIIQTKAIYIKGNSYDDNGYCSGSAAVRITGGVGPFNYLWTPGNQTSDSIKGICAGIYCCTVTDSDDCQKTICVTVNKMLGVGMIHESSSEWSVYPDPNTGHFTIESVGTQNFVSTQWSVEIYNVLGEKVYSGYLPQTPKGALSEIDLSDQANGLYLIRILNKDGSLAAQKKIVKTQ